MVPKFALPALRRFSIALIKALVSVWLRPTMFPLVRDLRVTHHLFKLVIERPDLSRSLRCGFGRFLL